MRRLLASSRRPGHDGGILWQRLQKLVSSTVRVWRVVVRIDVSPFSPPRL